MPFRFPLLRRRFASEADGFAQGPQTEEPVAVFGDLHGCFDLLDQLIFHAADRAARFVFVGDMIDRGPDSARVLATLHDWQTTYSNVHCLAGNHEQMLLGFLDDPQRNARVWLRAGGLQTFRSFGISVPPERSLTPDLLVQLRDALRLRLGAARETWLRGLPMIWHSGTLAVSHAGADPDKSIWDQTAQDLLWGHPNFQRKTRQDGIWLAHGHWIAATPRAKAGRISVDSGAYATGVLTAAIIAEGQVRFISQSRGAGFSALAGA